MPGFAHSVNPNLNVGGAWKLYTFAWTFSTVTSFVVYYVICRWIYPQTITILDVSVLPPQRGDLEGVAVEQGATCDAQSLAKSGNVLQI